MAGYRKALGLTAGTKGPCEICGRSSELVADHCHKVRAARGRLCRKCNAGLGMFCDSPRVLLAAAEYLTHKAQRLRTQESARVVRERRAGRPATPLGFSEYPTDWPGVALWRAQ